MAAAGLTLAVLAAACRMPVEQPEPLGVVLSGVLDGSSDAAAADLLSIPWVDETNTTVSGLIGKPTSTDFALRFLVVLLETSASEAEPRGRSRVYGSRGSLT